MTRLPRALASVLAGSAVLSPAAAVSPRVERPKPAVARPTSQPASQPTRAGQNALSARQTAYRASQKGPHDLTIADAAQSKGLDPYVLDRLLYAESRKQPDAYNRRTRARGMGQHVPSGAAAVGRLQRARGVRDWFTYAKTLDPVASIYAAAELLAHGLDVCGSMVRALGMYNTGRCVSNAFARRVLRLADWMRMQSEPRT